MRKQIKKNNAVGTPEREDAMPSLSSSKQIAWLIGHSVTGASPLRRGSQKRAHSPQLACEPISIIDTVTKGRGVIATRHIGKGETILKFVGEIVSRRRIRNPNAALQLDKDLFL